MVIWLLENFNETLIMKYIASVFILSLAIFFYTSCAKDEKKKSDSSSSGSVTSSSGAVASGSITVDR